MQIVLTLQTPATEARITSKDGISSSDLTILQDLKLLTGPWKNFANLRKAMEAMQGAEHPCLPFLGLFMSDMQSLKVLPLLTEDGLISVWRCRRLAALIRQFRGFQEDARRYDFERKSDLYDALVQIHTLNKG